MISRQHVPATLLAAALFASALAACEGDTIENPPPAKAGAAGASGQSGASGSAGSSAGAGGNGGSSAGSGGTAAGSAGTAGAAGNTAGAAGSAGATAGNAGASGASAGNAGQAGAAGGPTCVPTAIPTGNGKKPLFVAKDGNDSNDGSIGAPLLLVSTALAKIASDPQTPYHLYIAEGTYDAPVVLPDVDGLEIEGGYKRANDTWTRTCDATARDLAVLTASTATDNQPVVLAKDLLKGASLHRLTIKTKDQGASGAVGKTGETLIGVFVKGAGSKLTLDDVSIIVGKGGDGGPGVDGGPSTAVTCNGLTDCEDGGKGADGADGEPAAPGTFGENGYSAGVGTTGTAGAKGKNGAIGADGQDASCAISCPVVAEADQAQCKTKTPDQTGTVAAKKGTCGCGASAKQPGGGAASGGASLGLVVGAGASLTTSVGRIATTGGGAGPDGGAAGPALAATEGSKGEDATCVAKAGARCGYDTVLKVCSPEGTNVPLAGGAPGTKGGESGKSGKGGPGAGGQSFAIVKIGSAVVDFKSEPTYVVGPGGKSGSTGAAAKSGNVGPLVTSLDLHPFHVIPMRPSDSFSRRLLASLALSSATALLVTACSGDDFVAPASQGGSGGASGAASAGKAGSGGGAGKAGGAGTSGAAGTGGGGAAGSGGAAGVAGAAGSAGGAGAAGAAGAGGAPVPGGCSESSPKFRCIGTQVLQQCNPSTKLYETLKTCTATEQCNATTQTCDTCKAGAPEPGGKCASENAQRVCAIDGSGYTEIKTCPAGASICKDNACEGCKLASDCPAPSGVCQVAACNDSKCGLTNLPKGPAPGAPPATGCVTKICDGLGALIDAVAPEGTSCGTDKKCDATGACLPCLPAPGAAQGSTVPACADALLCNSADVSGDQDAIFVSAAGSDSNAGGPSTPMATITNAVARAAVNPAIAKIYVAAGAYASPTIGEAPQALVVEGGFVVDGSAGTWKRSCEPGAFAKTVIGGPAPSDGMFLKLKGHVELKSMTIVGDGGGGVAQANFVPSVYGIYAQFAPNGFKLTAVSVVAKNAKTGRSGSPGPDGFVTEWNCAEAGTGAKGASASPGAHQSVEGIFDVAGFEPGQGEDGLPGEPGKPGIDRGMNYRRKTGLVTLCRAFEGPATCAGSLTVDYVDFYLGLANFGCGAGAGREGNRGFQGGGVFGVYLGTDAPVSLVASRISAFGAGNGGSGGLGGKGQKAEYPTEASSPLTAVPDSKGQCIYNGAHCVAIQQQNPPLIPPITGGIGGDGGNGSNGGSGWGGPTVGVLARSGDKVSRSASSTISVGSASMGGSGTKGGIASQIHVVP